MSTSGEPREPSVTVDSAAEGSAEGDASARQEAAHNHRERRARQRARRRETVRMADYSTIGLAFPIAIAMCWFAGGWVGGWFGATSAGHWIGGGFGLVAGFYNVYRTAMLLQQQDVIEVDQQGGRDRGGGP